MASSEFPNDTHMNPAVDGTPILSNETPLATATATGPAPINVTTDSSTQGLPDPPLHPGSPQWKTPSEWRQTHQSKMVDYVDLYGTPAEEEPTEPARGEWNITVEGTRTEQEVAEWGNDNGWGDEGGSGWDEVDPATATMNG